MSLLRGSKRAVEREFNKCTANVIVHSRPDAWQHIDTPADSLDHLRARSVDRMVYVCQNMFISASPGRVANDARNNNIIANRTARWTAGERMSRCSWGSAICWQLGGLPQIENLSSHLLLHQLAVGVPGRRGGDGTCNETVGIGQCERQCQGPDQL